MPVPLITAIMAVGGQQIQASGNIPHCPQTGLGKFIGSISGRNSKCDPTLSKDDSKSIMQGRTSSALSGNISFGGAQSRYNPLIILGVVGAIILIVRELAGGKRKRRR